MLRFPATLLAALAFCGTAFVATDAARADELNVAYIPCGKVNDQSWSQAGYMGAQAAQKELKAAGTEMKLDYSESLPPAQVEAAARDYASRGYQIVIFHCGTFADGAVAAAKAFPETTFLFATTPPKTDLPPNFYAYDVAQNEASFVSGYLAALISETDQVGAVGAFDFPVLTRQVEGFRLGARYAKPEIDTYATYINSWDDAGKAKEATQAQIDSGADVVFAATDQAARGVFAAAEGAGTYAIASYAPQHELAPDAILESAVYDYGKLLKEMILNAKEGKLEKGKFYRYGLDGYSALIYNPELEDDIPADARAKVDALIEDIKSGKIKVPELTTAGASESFDVSTIAAE